MNLIGLEFDHPGFAWRLTLMLETWLSFTAAGAGHAVFSVACTESIAPRLWRYLANEEMNGYISPNVMTILLINVVGAWNSFSSRVSRDYRLHYGDEPSTSRLLLLEFLRAGGFFFTRLFLSRRATIFWAPLRFFVPDPSALLSALYTILVLWAIFCYLPELTVISSHGFTIPKFVARMTGLPAQIWMQVVQETAAGCLLKPLSPNGLDEQTLYRYAPILTPRTIRLLRIDSSQETPSCTLEAVNLDDAPCFWAVSYLWGSEEKGQLLKITGPDGGYISITSNCAASIRDLIPIGVRHLWIDAVCINQVDTREKEIQVPLMRQIYSQASLVVGHLQTDGIMSVGLLIHRMIQSVANGKKFGLDSGSSIHIYWELSKIFTHQYFERAWIVQEMVLAKSLLFIYGRDCIYLDHLTTISNAQSKDMIVQEDSESGRLRKLITWMVQKSVMWTLKKWLTDLSNGQPTWKSEEWSRFILSIANFRERTAIAERLRLTIEEKGASKRLTFAQVVDDNLSLGAKYPRDQVYALLSLVSDSTVPELQPNYSVTVSDKEIFTRISWHYLQGGRHLNLFLSAGLSSKRSRTPGLPSWAYDFATGPASSYRLANWAANVERNREASLACRLSPEYLSVYGTIIEKVAFVASNSVQPDELSAVTTTPTLGYVMKTTVTIVDETQDMAQKYVKDQYPGEVTREEAYWRAMIMDRFLNQTPAPSEARASFEILYNMARQLSTDPTNLSWVAKDPLGLSKLKLNRERKEEYVGLRSNSIMESLTRIWLPYTFVVLDSGYMGWAPHGVEAGDVFCLFEGCISPFVLRPTPNADTFSLWGDGYVQGFMPGQRPGVEGRPKEWLKLI